MTRRARLISVAVVLVLGVCWAASSLAASGGRGFDLQGRIPLDAGAPTLDPRTYPGYHEASAQVLLDINLGVPYFNQCNSSWGSNVMQTCSSTICNAGCALTSTAMVFKYYGAVNKNPGQLNTCLGNYACPIYWATASSSCSEGKASFVGKYGYNLSLLVSGLEDGRPLIVEVVKGTSTHWVVVRKVYGDGLSESCFSINDPNGGVFRALTYYTNNGWTGNSIVIYSKV